MEGRKKKKKKELKRSKEIVIRFSGSEIIERQATKFGTGAHVIVPKEYTGKKVKIILLED